MDITAKNKAREFAVASRVAGILSFVNAVILLVVLRGLVVVVDLDTFTLYFWLLEILLFALSGFALALIAYKHNREEVPDKKTKSIAAVCIVFSVLGIACLMILLDGFFGPKISVDYATIDHYLQP